MFLNVLKGKHLKFAWVKTAGVVPALTAVLSKYPSTRHWIPQTVTLKCSGDPKKVVKVL